LQSGQPVTYPNGQYTWFVVPSYGLRNEASLIPSFRCFCYFITYQNENKNWKGEWVLVSITFIIAKMQHLLTLDKMKIQAQMKGKTSILPAV
jgi:hypothetical protein